MHMSTMLDAQWKVPFQRNDGGLSFPFADGIASPENAVLIFSLLHHKSLVECAEYAYFIGCKVQVQSVAIFAAVSNTNANPKYQIDIFLKI